MYIFSLICIKNEAQQSLHSWYNNEAEETNNKDTQTTPSIGGQSVSVLQNQLECSITASWRFGWRQTPRQQKHGAKKENKDGFEKDANAGGG